MTLEPPPLAGGEQIETPAQRAAALLPAVAPALGRSAAARVVGTVFAVALLSAPAAAAIVWVGPQRHGWLYLLAGIPAWVMARWVLLRLRGTETGVVAVDQDGVVRVLAGRWAISRLRRLFDVGARRWAWQGVAVGVLLLALLAAGSVAAASAVEVAWVGTAAFATAMLDVLRVLLSAEGAIRKDRLRGLSSRVMLPVLALHARTSGLENTLAGVPADRLLATLAAHPSEAKVIADYTRLETTLAQLAGDVNSTLPRSGLPGL